MLIVSAHFVPRDSLLSVDRGEYLDYSEREETATVKTRLWQRWDFHYDNVAYAMLTLFAVQTGEGWPA